MPRVRIPYTIEVKQSVWHNQVGEPKREKSKGTIPVIAQLRLFLDQHRASSGNPSRGFIFRNSLGNPLNLDLLVTEVLRPALEAEKIPWHGWHAFRRGLATNLHRLGVSDKVIQQILRHANVTTTINIYVKMVTEDAEEAMKRLESKCSLVVPQTVPQRGALCLGLERLRSLLPANWPSPIQGSLSKKRQIAAMCPSRTIMKSVRASPLDIPKRGLKASCPVRRCTP